MEGFKEDYDPNREGNLDFWENKPNSCEYEGAVSGPAIDWVLKYATDEEAWITDYLDAWKVATENVITYTQDQTKSKADFEENYHPYVGGEKGQGAGD